MQFPVETEVYDPAIRDGISEAGVETDVGEEHIDWAISEDEDEDENLATLDDNEVGGGSFIFDLFAFTIFFFWLLNIQLVMQTFLIGSLCTITYPRPQSLL